MLSSGACLGLSIMGTCNYDPSKPIIYFTIGEGIGALAILFLLKQFIGPIERFRLSVRKYQTKITEGLFFLAASFVLIASILPIIPGEAWPLVGYPFFWEVIAGIFFIGTIFWFYRIMTKPVVISRNNCKRYAQQCYHMLTKGNENDLGLFAIEIKESIEPIFSALKNRDRNYTYAEHAEAIVFMLSDKKLSKIIVNNAFFTLHKLFEQIKKHPTEINLKCYRSLIRELINQLIINPESILSRENGHSGLGVFKVITDIFRDYSFIASNLYPLESWNYYSKDIKPWEIKNYFFILETALESCIKNKTFRPRPNPFISPFENIASLTISMAYKLKHLPENEAQESLPYQLLSEISSGFMRILAIINDNPSDVEIEFNPHNYNYLDDSSIYGIVSYGIFQFFKSLSACLSHDQLIDGLTRCIWCDIDNHYKNTEIQKRFYFHILNKSKDNLENHYYPMVSRLIIKLVGLSEPKPYNGEELGNRFANDFRSLIKINYRKVIAQKPEFAKEMLPETVFYDQQNNTLTQKWPREVITTLTLD